MRPHLCCLLFATWLAALPVAAPAQDTALPEMAEIEQAWTRGDFVTVRKGLEQLAQEDGSALAQYRYGRVLLEGRGGPQNIAEAQVWLEKAVTQNHAEAATLLARVFLSDLPGGPARDATRAAELLTRAAPRGNTEAQFLLGLLYRSGDGVPADAETAFAWFLAAAEQQHTQAQLAVARAYLEAPEATRNTDEGLRWLRAAAEEGLAEAQLRLAIALENPPEGDVNLSEVLDWYRRAAEAGNPLAQRMLGTRYLRGDGVAPDASEAFRWLTAAAQAGETGAMSNLGFAYATGTGTEVDLDAARRWYSAAAAQGLGRAMVALGALNRDLEDEGLDTALVWYMRALETEDAGLARQALAQLAIDGALDGRMAPQRMVPWVRAALGDGVAGAENWLADQSAAGVVAAQSALGRHLLETDPARAQEAQTLLRAASDGYDPQAQFALAEALASGAVGAAPDYVHAHAWFNVAATLGHPDAPERRSVLGQLMTPEQVAEAQAITRAFFEAETLQPDTSGN